MLTPTNYPINIAMYIYVSPVATLSTEKYTLHSVNIIKIALQLLNNKSSSFIICIKIMC